MNEERMSDTNCDDAIRALGEYLHHELCSEDAAVVHAHLEGCESCAQELRVNSVLIECVQRACKERAPETLRSQVLAALRAPRGERA